MQETINAVYENGVIKPLQKIHLREHEKLTITIEKKKKESKAKAQKSTIPLVGIFESGAGDLSSAHDKYLYGWEKGK